MTDERRYPLPESALSAGRATLATAILAGCTADETAALCLTTIECWSATDEAEAWRREAERWRADG